MGNKGKDLSFNQALCQLQQFALGPNPSWGIGGRRVDKARVSGVVEGDSS